MTAIAVLGVGLALGGWLGIRWSDARHRLEHDLTTYLTATIPTGEADQ